MDQARFVVLKHTQPSSQLELDLELELELDLELDRIQWMGRADVHYDLMLQTTLDLQTGSLSQLLTWALPQPPTTMLINQHALRLAPHRIDYLDYEGPISNDRGTVEQIMKGSWQLITINPALTLDAQFDSAIIELSAQTPSPTTCRITLAHQGEDKFLMNCNVIDGETNEDSG